MKIKKLLITLLAAAVVAAGWYTWSSRAGRDAKGLAAVPAANPLEATVTVRDIEEKVDAVGFVRPELSSEVKAEVSGKINKIHIKDGQKVKKGQPLIELDPTIVRTDEAEARQNLQLQQFSLEKATRDLKRADALHAQGFVSEREQQDAQTAYEVSKLQRDSAQARLERAEENTRKTIITAPHDGTVSDSNGLVEGFVVIGAQSINNGTALMRISDVSILRVDLSLNEFAATRVRLDAEATITFDSLPGLSKKGKVSFMAPFATADPKNPDLRVFPCQVSFPAGEGSLPGISANISVLIIKEKQCMAVPVSAIFIEGSESIAYVKDAAGTWQRRVIKVGLSDSGWSQVKSGLKASETVSLVRPASQPAR
jgi:RND family efflux transporter MFP subunit